MGLAVNNITTTSSKIQWNVVNCAVGYRYQYRKKGTTTWKTAQLSGKNNVSKTLTALTASTTYQWRVLTGCKTTPDTIVSSYKTGPEFTTLLGFASAQTEDDNAKSINPSTIKIYPNPSKGRITVTYNSSNAGYLNLKINDIAGKQVFLQNETAVKGMNTFHLDLTHITAGVYVFELISNEKKKRVKFVIEK